ncbi:dihydrofolate synthase, partial [Streptomyces sp. NPDC059130]
TKTSPPRASPRAYGEGVRVGVWAPAGRAPAPPPPEALEAAVTLAEEEAEYAGAGILVTGSVITVGEARLLLGKG